MATLYIVATPIGNLSDMTFRAIETLKSVDFIICEDTRKSGILCKKYEIETSRISFHAQSSERKAEEIILRLCKGESGAYISDAGTPCISDPGFKLTNLLRQQHPNVQIIPIPGPCALTTLLSASGLPTDKFTFLGFLPHKKGRQTILSLISSYAHSIVFYESVHRFPKLLKELEEYLEPNQIIAVGRELTKIHEDIFRGTITEAKNYYNESNTKGEFVVMIAPTNFS